MFNKIKNIGLVAVAVTVAVCAVSMPAQAMEEFTIIIKDHKFSPETTIIPVDQKVKLIIDNQDTTPEEFESYELNREKIISGGKKGIVFIGPLKSGTYPFFGEFNMDTAQGNIIVK